MKLKQFILLMSVMLYGTEIVHASSNLASSMASASANLAIAQAALANAMGISNQNASVNSGVMAKNSSNKTVFLIIYDANKQEISPTIISLAPNAFSYIPTNTTLLKVIDYNHKQLVAPTAVVANTLYTITYNSAEPTKPWSLVSSPSTPVTSAYTYKNSTTIPLIVTITTANSMKDNQQIIPGASYSKQVIPLSAISVEAHANISPIYCAYNASASYSLTIGTNNKLVLTQTSATDSTLTNNSGWPMLVRAIASSESEPTVVALDDKGQIQPTGTNIMIMPAVVNNMSTDSTGATTSCNIVNTNGQLEIQLA